MLLVRTRLASSPIHGIGLFADERIARGTPIWRYVDGFDSYVDPSVVEQLSGPAREQLLKYAYRDQESGSWALCGDDARHFNHSEVPNTVSSIDANGDEIYVAAEEILPGAEITCDYRAFDPDWQTKLARRG
jgi:SET domain-containing protein